MWRPSIPRPNLGAVRGGVDGEVVIKAPPDAVVDLLATPDSVQDWFPIHVDLEGRKPRRWRPGSTFAISVTIAGERVRLDVTVERLDTDSLEFGAAGIVEV